MGLMNWLFGTAGAVGISAVAKLLADDAKEWAPWLTARLLRSAVRHLPEPMRERYADEWAGGLWETPGIIGKLIYVLGLQIASWRAREDHAHQMVVQWLRDAETASLTFAYDLEAISDDADPAENSAKLRAIAQRMLEHARSRPDLGFTLVGLRAAVGALFEPLRFYLFKRRHGW